MERVSTTEGIYQQMLENIREGEWRVGEAIPSERTLIEDFGVSRIAVREAVSMLRGLGVVDVSHGKRTMVRNVGIETLDQLLPLMLAGGSQQTFDQVFELRMAIESHAAYLAASSRTDEQLATLRSLAEKYRTAIDANSEDAVGLDLEFHLEVAHATGNPLFASLLGATARFVVFAQKTSCRTDSDRLHHAADAHDSIVAAIADSDPGHARAEMEAHLKYSASQRVDDVTAD